LRPDDDPVKGPKHVVLAINTTPHYKLCSTVQPCTIILSNTTGISHLKIPLFAAKS